MKVTLLLADFAQVSEGKLNIIGGGWSVTGPVPAQSAVAVKIEVPWDQANKRHHVVLELKDEDGHPVLLPTPPGDVLKPVRVDAALTPGKRYTWELSIDDETHEDWRVTFSVRAFPLGFQPHGFQSPHQTF
ncbi:MAG: hypothetical protein ABSA91_19990 [Acidimicrobiales bacterium]